MPYPEPSLNDHMAPWNWDDECDRCDCTSCNVQRKKAYLEEYGGDDENDAA